MSSQDSHPGKTAPRLLHDAIRFDPRNTIGGYNILIATPDSSDLHTTQTEPIHHKACLHNLATNVTQSNLPPEDYQTGRGTEYQVHALCRKCRIHLDVEVNYEAFGRRPCPNSDYPLHHFVYTGVLGTADFGFECSSPDCGAVLRVHYTEPVITNADLELLTDPDHLKRRYEEAVSRDTTRHGFLLSTPAQTLWKLRRYIRDALKPDSAGKKIPTVNKRFMESFGDDCANLLTRLGFEYLANGEESAWLLPQTGSHDSGLNPARATLECWDMELQALIEQTCARDGDLNPCPDYYWRNGKQDLERLIAAQGYAKQPTAQSLSQSTAFSGLGALPDYSDALVSFCYDRQSDCDPPNAPYYFDCLQSIANVRSSETLQLKASLLESQGAVSLKDIRDAYNFLDVDQSATDAFIVSKYRSRLEDTGPSMHGQMKVMLRRLGTMRASQTLLDAASDTLETYQQALSWLSAESSYPDDAIITLHTAKVADNSSNKDMANRAVKLIADQRNSEILRSWLKTGEVKASSMDVDEACRHLNIDLKSVDESMLTTVIEMARSDNPGKRTEEAIEVVIRAYRQTDHPSSHDPSTWPVGLTSHGNTCYLNSLLQYYFTIKPLRDIVLNFDDHKYDPSVAPLKRERVGGLKVRPFEIRAYQKFVEDLHHLFDRMIKEPGSAVKPEADLVCRAFLKAEDTELQISSSAASDVGQDHLSRKDITMTGDESQIASEHLESASSQTASLASSVTLADSTNGEATDATKHEATAPLSPPVSRAHSPSNDRSDSLRPPLPPRGVTTPERQQTNLSKAEEAARQQQDVTEVMDEILFRLRAAIQPKGMDAREEQLDLFRDIFYMRIAERSFVEGQPPTSSDEDAINILLNIPSGPTDIYSALDEVFDLQTIDHGDKKLTQYKSLQTLPPVLQINIPRNTYDPKLGRGVKVEHKMHLEETLYMDRYFDTPDSNVLELRKQCWNWRKRLQAMQVEKDILCRTETSLEDGAAVLDAASQYLSSLTSANEALADLDMPLVEVDESLPGYLSTDAETQRQKLVTIDQSMAELKTRIAAQFDGMQKLKYRLQAVFFHRGGYGHGHYWTYIHDFQNNVWRHYNDEKVEEFTKVNDIYDAETWQQGTPTYAVYVRDDVKDEYAEAVCRHPEQPAAQAAPVDEVMYNEVASADVSARQDVGPAPDYPAPEPGAAKAEGNWESNEYNSATSW